MDLIELLRSAAVATEAVLSQVGPTNADRRTPCPEMSVSEAAAHLIGGISAFVVVGEGGELAFGAPTDLDPHGEHPAADFRSAVDRLIAVFSEPGRLDASFAMPWGPTAGAQLVGFELIETVVHGWDIASGLGVTLPVEDDVAQATLDGARNWVDDSVRVPGMFGPEVAYDGGTALDRLVAFLGREPAWTGNDDAVTPAGEPPQSH